MSTVSLPHRLCRVRSGFMVFLGELFQLWCQCISKSLASVWFQVGSGAVSEEQRKCKFLGLFQALIGEAHHVSHKLVMSFSEKRRVVERCPANFLKTGGSFCFIMVSALFQCRFSLVSG